MEVSKSELKEFKFVNDRVAYNQGRRDALTEATALLAYFLLKEKWSVTVRDLDLLMDKYDVEATKNHDLSTTYRLKEKLYAGNNRSVLQSRVGQSDNGQSTVNA